MLLLTYPSDYILMAEVHERSLKKNMEESAGALRQYIFVKVLMDKICDCLDFINFSIVVRSEGMKITAVDSLLFAEDINRYINILTNNRMDKTEEGLLEKMYANRFHSLYSCSDNEDCLRLLERKLKNLEALGIIKTPVDAEEISFDEAADTMAEIGHIMKKLGVDCFNIPDSTLEIAERRFKDNKTVRLYECTNSY
ncbi:MAG: hypothetical protein IJX15_09715 [Ruminiclostridium sp.]|nr:hypothetical protein [Ruminiclostridium sp.]MBQ8842712.1 hypothetical protein [Ruminiclostridium sp.]